MYQGKGTKESTKSRTIYYVNNANEKHPCVTPRARADTRTQTDVEKVAKQVLNRAACNRIVSKQECMVLLGGLDLYRCSDRLSLVPLGDGYRLTTKNTKNPTGGNFRVKYENRSDIDAGLSLYEYYHKIKNTGVDPSDRTYNIPHFVGIQGQPCFPPSDSYCRSVLKIYKPWRRLEEIEQADDLKGSFFDFILSSNCPTSVYQAYNRVHMRYLERMYHKAVAMEVNHNNNPITEEDSELQFCAMGGSEVTGDGILEADSPLAGANFGEDHDWSKHYFEVSIVLYHKFSSRVWNF